MSASPAGTGIAVTPTSFTVSSIGAATIIAGWFRFTSTSANSRLVALDGSTALYIASNAALGLTINRGTTDRVLTSPTNTVSTNQWTFIATVFGTLDISGAPFSEFLWVGSETSIPTRRTWTVGTSGSGGITGANGTFRVGSTASGGSNTMSGLVSQVSIMTMNGYTATSLDESYLFTRFIYPLYLGRFDIQQMFTSSDGGASDPTLYVNSWYMPFDTGLYNGSTTATSFPVYENAIRGFVSFTKTTNVLEATTSTTTGYSSEEPAVGKPRPDIINFSNYPLLMRR